MPGLATLSEASAYGARGGGGGARPTDPASLAARALNAAMGDDRETALKLYDYGMENYGTDFITAYNGLRDSRELGEASVTPSKPGVLKQVIDTIKVGENANLPPVPESTGYEMKPASGLPRTEGGKGGIFGAGGLPTTGGLPRSPPMLRSVSDTAPIEPPEPAPYLPQGADAAVAGSLREAELAAAKYRADQQAAANAAKATTLGDATRDAQALIESGMTPEQAVTEALKQPGVATVLTVDDLRSSLGLPVVPKAPVANPAPPPPLAVVTDNVPTPAPAPNLPPVPAPSSNLPPVNAAPAPAPTPNLPPVDAQPPPSGHYGLQPDGSYIDIPPGNEVSLPEDTVTMVAGTGLPARLENDPRIEPGDPRYKGARKGGSGIPKPNRQFAAPPDSGGLATTVQAPPPPPAVDTGTNTTPSTSTTSTTVAAGPPAVDTNQPPVADDSGFMGKPDIWSFLTSAGLGAMASGSPNFLGAVGAGGRAGVEQLGVLRKDQRERQKNLADAEFQKNRIKLGIYDTQHADLRNDRTLKSGERNTDVTTDAANRRNTDTLRSGERNTDQTNRTHLDINTLNNAEQYRRQDSAQQHATQQAEQASQLRRTEADYADHIRDNNLRDDAETKFKFYIDHGHTPEVASRMAGGYAPPTEKTPTFSPMGEKETAQALDIAAGTIIGEGGNGQQLMAMIGKLPSKVASEVLQALNSQQAPGGGAKAVMDVLRKYGITYKDGGWFTDPSLSMSKTEPAPAPPAGGGSNPRYVPGQGIVR